MAESKNISSVFSHDRPIHRVALYARVSTLNGLQDPEMQLSELRDYVTRRGLSIHEEYVDQGVSGSKESQPALNRLMSDAQRCRFDAVLVWKIDRFGRSLKPAFGCECQRFRNPHRILWPANKHPTGSQQCYSQA